MEGRAHYNQQIVSAFRQKDLKIIESFYRDNWSKVRGYVLSQGGGEELAKDIMQNGMLSLFFNIRNDKYKPNKNALISTYFFQLCKFQLMDHFKSAHHTRTESIKMENEEFEGKGSSIEEELNRMERRKMISAYVQQLGERCQHILHAFYWEELNLKALAVRFELSEESAKNAKYRCLKQLKHRMSHLKSHDL